MIKAMRTSASEPDGTTRIVFVDENGKEAAKGTFYTDLKPGKYRLRADITRKKWVIISPPVPTGLRFDVELDGKDPWTLAYANIIDLDINGNWTIGDMLAGTVDIGKVKPKEHPNYIEQVVKSVSIPIWGGAFSLNRENLGYLMLARQECRLDDDPVAGQLELMSVYKTREFAMAAISRFAQGGYSYYLGLGGHIWPTTISDSTAPWLCASLRKAIEVERADAKAAENLGWNLLLRHSAAVL
jgi:hypothetical protein